MALRDAGKVTIHFPVVLNEQGEPTLWLASWLISSQGHEADWFYSGRGGEEVSKDCPAGAVGVRVRRWVSDGLPPEYADAQATPGTLNAETLDFDHRSRQSDKTRREFGAGCLKEQAPW